jgi:hypothetical protein
MKSLLLNIIYYIFQHLFFSIIYIYIYLVDKYLYSLKGHKHRLHLRPFENRARPGLRATPSRWVHIIVYMNILNM